MNKGEVLYHQLSDFEKRLVAQAALKAFLKERQARSTPRKTEGNRLPSKRQAIIEGTKKYWETERLRRAKAKEAKLSALSAQFGHEVSELPKKPRRKVVDYVERDKKADAIYARLLAKEMAKKSLLPI